MAEQTSTTNTTPNKTRKQRYPRSKWFAWVREALHLGRYFPIIFLAFYLFISLSTLKSLDNINNDRHVFLDPISKHVFIYIPIYIVLCGIFIFLGYWAKKDEKDEDIFIEEERKEREYKRRKKEGEQKEAEKQQPPPTGFKLRYTLAKHTDTVNSVAWSPDGKMLASGAVDMTIRLWDPQSGEVLWNLTGHTDSVFSVAWSPDGKMLASGGRDKIIRLWDPQSGEVLRNLTGHTHAVNSVAWSPEGKMLASGGNDKIIRLWDPQSGEVLRNLTGHTHTVNSVAWSPDGKILASSGRDKIIRLWDPQSGEVLRNLTGHTHTVNSVAWSPDGKMLASGSSDDTIRLWDPQRGQCIRILEEHTDSVTCVLFSTNGQLLVFKSTDGTVCLWSTDTWECVSVLHEYCEWLVTISFHPTLPILTTLGEEEKAIRIWDLDIDAILSNHSSTSSSYTNAKVVLLGDSGVGKSGLGLVLSNQPFSVTESTHARHVWNFDKKEVELAEGRKENRETLLWDLAGQPGYRLIHQLYLNEVAVALVVFDARSETDPFAGVYHWDRALRQAQSVQGSSALPLKKILVQARVDRGSVGVSSERIQALMDECGFDAYFATSAKEGRHIADLRAAVCNAINWDALPKISSTQLFQNIKSFLIAEKETGRHLSTVDDLYNTFLKSKDAPDDKENLYAQFETCVGRVEAAGLIKRLSFGKFVLLQPELLDIYASALINNVRDEPDGLGNIEEERVRKGDFHIPQGERLKNKEHEELLLIAMIEDLLRRELALREDAFLIFPSQSTRENPDLPELEGKAVVFDFEGPILNIYTTLAVRLSYSGHFRKKALWKNAITYTAAVGGVCGMALHNIDEGRGALTLFFSKTEAASEETRFNFEEFIQAHLQRKAIPGTFKRRRIFTCSECGFVVSDQLIRIRNERGFDWLDCPGCNDNRILLLDRQARITATPSQHILEMDRAADTQRDREAAKTTIQGKEATMDFDVFLCHNGIDKPAVKKIGEQLKEQGLLPWLDVWELRPGLPWQRALEEQIEHIKAAAVFVGKDGMGPWQQLELEAFLREFVHRECPVIPVLLDYAPKEPQLPIFLRGMTWVDFRKSDSEPMENLIWGVTGTRKLGR